MSGDIQISEERRTRLNRFYADHQIPDSTDARIQCLRKTFNYGTIHCDCTEGLTKEQIEKRRLLALELVVATYHLPSDDSQVAA